MMIWDSNCPFRVSKSRRDSWIAEGHCSKRTGETENMGPEARRYGWLYEFRFLPHNQRGFAQIMCLACANCKRFVFMGNYVCYALLLRLWISDNRSGLPTFGIQHAWVPNLGWYLWVLAAASMFSRRFVPIIAILSSITSPKLPVSCCTTSHFTSWTRLQGSRKNLRDSTGNQWGTNG